MIEFIKDNWIWCIVIACGLFVLFLHVSYVSHDVAEMFATITDPTERGLAYVAGSILILSFVLLIKKTD